jgi:hypothetical protein
MARCQPTWRSLRKCQLQATLCVTLSLALFALGGSDPTGEFFLRTLSLAGPSIIMGPVWDTIVVSHAVIASVMCEEYGGVQTQSTAPLTVSCEGPSSLPLRL